MIKQTDDYIGKVRDFLAAHRDFEVERAQRALSEATTQGDDESRQIYEDRVQRLRAIRIM
ncbi:hypothetical protein [Phytohabitans aurantiacus]|uniref:Uncharacterized protein n=1 Tax=Phytohabitans aurantiacus TaxID=3016789 RepID=A0ABQ5R8Z9_9ACTN|nr:hypothetical protein [Phytohabitans aurantiacus]GLI03053.1 hypothetical protein Pa4123_83310 [Phytohabitans aurantiacus]